MRALKAENAKICVVVMAVKKGARFEEATKQQPEPDTVLFGRRNQRQRRQKQLFNGSPS